MRRAFSVAVSARQCDRVLVIHHRRLAAWLPLGGELEAGETPLEAAARELREESGLEGRFARLRGACDGVPPGLIGYEEHPAGDKGLHMNFVYVAEVAPAAAVVPNHEFVDFRWVSRDEILALDSPRNVREFGLIALAAELEDDPS